ncbi:hypothetical protein E3P92_00768 [Wallemia ichthyophaga]|uniref:Protein phosphatase 1 regulatory subunit 7 n=1 Tax=Wallemia ichthyophaga TaxID=245174 RepID=A0A4T0JL50_WALIC|nr:hypothetical protein E3P91_00377 [Wallemia ichthyophaga]TIB14018.1 hypothetical protein E3P90_01425 [Wallemia ichthyophaga]TIB15902.1 hypothetical protein E3P93_01176 [Wallemia ichthyophaga]TIB18187.1 hypothetical protein E3P92_00768 [Wallemia ichthyophaga]TIB22412.1 hypothetical protein E3P89_02102 [Wallemia ichthyophaga]
MEVDLVHLKLQDEDLLEELNGFGSVKDISKLYLRQNLLKLQDELIGFDNLVELDLYDNKLESENLINLKHLKLLDSLDLSFNLIRWIHTTLQQLPLKQLYLIQNKLSKIENLNIPTLQVLELGGNRLRHIENLHNLHQLQQLWLGKNKIEKIENINSLNIDGLGGLSNLKELYLSHNGIKDISGLDDLVNLEVLDISNNQIKSINNLSHLKKLQELWANSNQIDNLDGVESQLQHIQSLHTIYLEHNPIQHSLNTSYRRKLKILLPQLKQIDATLTQ